MAIGKFADFIPQNVAPKDAVRIGVYDRYGKRLGKFALKHLAFPNLGEKLYSFGVLSDVHLQQSTGTTDFQRALTYLNDTEDVAFTCICGDLTQNGSETQLARYKTYVDTYSPSTPVYAISGNHETYSSLDVENVISTYTGKPLYYSFTKGDDVFIMVGIRGEVTLFTTAELQWLYETLEANRNKRCFVFMHVFPGKDKTVTCGNAYGLYHNYCWSHATQTVAFESLMAHYKNVVFFHGHSHLKFELQAADCQYANYDESKGYRSVHIPSITVIREDENGDGTVENNTAGSQGYVADVYANALVLRGRDFVGGKTIPVAIYCLDTSLVNVPAGEYNDSTGTIKK